MTNTNQLDREALDELHRISKAVVDARQRYEAARKNSDLVPHNLWDEFEEAYEVFEKTISSNHVLSLIELAGEGLEAREQTHLHCENGCQKVVFESRCIKCGGRAVNVADCDCRPTPERPDR